MLENVKRTTIEPIILRFVKAGCKVYTDEYNIYNWLPYTYVPNTVNYSKANIPEIMTEVENMKSMSIWGQLALSALVGLLVATWNHNWAKKIMQKAITYFLVKKLRK